MSEEPGSHSSPSPPASPDDHWEREVLRELAASLVQERRRARRWGIFFKSLLFVYLFALLFIYAPHKWEEAAVGGGLHTALVKVDGIIGPDSQASADNIIKGLDAAFRDRKTAGVILQMDTPGGSPVQAGYVNDEIFRLRDKYPKIPIYAVITDICASGGYYIASAADQIYADKASIVGSIGVRMDSFGFVNALDKLGIQRRLMTAGAHKGFLDPFLPLNPEDVAHIQGMLDDIHQQFINTVKKGRGKRLKNDPKLFNGWVWTGEQSLALGLVDGLGSTRYVALDLIGAKRIVDYTPHEGYIESVAKRLGTTLTQVLDGTPALR